VTTASIGLSDDARAAQPLAGRLLRLRPGPLGLPSATAPALLPTVPAPSEPAPSEPDLSEPDPSEDVLGRHRTTFHSFRYERLKTTSEISSRR
jgi:hypothetical protein